MLAKLEKIFEKNDPVVQEQRYFLITCFHNEEVNNYPDEKIKQSYKKIKNYFLSVITKFSKICLPELNFFNFTISEFIKYFYDEKEFALKLNKKKGRAILYGIQHTVLRRFVINGIPKSLRISSIMAKITKFKMLPKMFCILESDDLIHLLNTQKKISSSSLITDIQDIGMGHSVFLVNLLDKDQTPRQIVIKQEELPNQAFYCRIVKKLGWPSYKSLHFEDSSETWEITEYLGDRILGKILPNISQEDLDQIVPQLASHAALGDILGRGDRHFENYIFHKNNLFPIDISYLFWPDNEKWIQKYLWGGQGEFSILLLYQHNKKLFKKKEAEFFNAYQKTINKLKEQQDLIAEEIKQFYGENQVETQTKLSFVNDRLDSTKQYIVSQKELYSKAYEEMQKRRYYKNLLEELVRKKPSVLDKNPLLKMYYLADKDRYTGFFLLEEHRQDLFSKLNSLEIKLLKSSYNPLKSSGLNEVSFFK